MAAVLCPGVDTFKAQHRSHDRVYGLKDSTVEQKDLVRRETLEWVRCCALYRRCQELDMPVWLIHANADVDPQGLDEVRAIVNTGAQKLVVTPTPAPASITALTATLAMTLVLTLTHWH